MRVAVIGQGYVGLTVSMGALSGGHQVVGVDIDEGIVENLNRGQSHIEGVADADVGKAITSGTFQVTSDFRKVKDSDIVVIAVPTPLNHAGRPDISLLESALRDIAPYLSDSTLVVNESTSFIGTLRNVIAKLINEINPRITDFAVSPERVDPGNVKYGLKNTPRVIGGLNTKATRRAVEFYASFCDDTVAVSSPEVAEASKLLENSFRFVNIGFVNEFTKIMDALNVPISEVISSASTKPYGFMTFFPNVGIGGHCIPVDPLYLQENAKSVNVPSQYIDFSQKLNMEMPEYAVLRLESLFGPLRGRHVLLVGITYKPDIADTRETPAESIILSLRKRGVRVSWHDPLVSEFSGEKSSPIQGEYDLALVLVKHQVLDLEAWIGKPIYSVNFTPSEPDWIPLFGSHNRK